MNAHEKAEKILNDLKVESDTVKSLENTSTLMKTADRWFSTPRFWYQFTTSFMFFYRRFIVPIYTKIWWLFKILFWNHFRKLWNRFAYKIDANGKRKFSKLNGSSFLAATTIFLFIAYQTLFLVIDTGLYLATARVNETVYLSNSQEINADRNIHSIQGCLLGEVGSEFSCDASSSLYFRVAPRLFNQLWSLTHGKGFFLPDYVTAPVAPGWQECIITSYGIRLKFFMRAWDWYPDLISAECRGI